MAIDPAITRLAQAAEEFNAHEHRADGQEVAGCLRTGLNGLRDAMFLRLHQDLEKAIGRDSMLVPISELKAEHETSLEVGACEVAESAAFAAARGYVQDSRWCLSWLAGLMARGAEFDPAVVERGERYLAQDADARRRTLMDALQRILPECAQAPLVLFRLLPLAVQIETAAAFGERAMAQDLRRQQIAILPSITDCRQCRGRLIECTERCRACGNPLWKHEWLVAADD